MNKWWKYLVWIGITIISIFFIQAGALKLLGDARMVDTFNTFGYPDWFRITIGILEIAGAISLFIRFSSRYGALCLAAIMIGAIASGLVAGTSDGAFMEAILLCCLVCIAIARKPDHSRKTNKKHYLPEEG